MELIDNFKYLPDEIIHMIINYTDVVVYRHGKYINRIGKNDNRFNLLKKIPKPIFSNYYILLRLINRDMFGYFIKYNFSDSFIKIKIQSFYREKDGFDKYYDIKSTETFIFDANNRWSKIVEYLM